VQRSALVARDSTRSQTKLSWDGLQ